jgi:hypothetical protein
MEPSRRQLSSVGWLFLPGLLAAGIALQVSRPFRAGPVAFDSAVAVLHFQRIVEGRHLEQFVSTTPKPLLTFIYGPLFGLTHDWRALTWVTILAFAVAVVLGTALARRLGGWVAGLFAAVALAGAPALLYDASVALATPWAMLLWAVAGLAVTASRPRYVVAGVALALASLARIETLVVVGVALVVLAGATAAQSRTGRRVPRGAWWLALALGALPVAMLHDWRLTGDPLFWLSVSGRYSALTHLRVLTPQELLLVLAHRYTNEAGLAVLAVIGWVRLLERRQWAIAVGLLGLGPGIAAFLVLLAARHIYVSERYFAAVDVAVVFAAAMGIEAVSVELPAAIRAWSAGHPRVTAWTRPVVVAFLAAAFSTGWAGFGTDLGTTLRAATKAALSEQLAIPVLRTAAAMRASGGTAGNTAWLLVPTQLRPHMVIDLGVSLPEVASFGPSTVSLANGRPAPGQYLLQSTGAGTSAGLKELEVSVPTRIGSVTVVPLLADPSQGTWVVRVDGN